MTSILCLTATILRNQFRCSYLSSKKTFAGLFSAFSKSRLTFEHMEKNMTIIADIFPKLQTAKDVVRKCLKSAVSEDTLTSNMVNGSKHF